MSERPYRLALLALGHGVFVALLALAWKHALLRSTCGDTAFQVFQWVGQPGWDIEAHRYTAIVPQACVKFMALFGPGLRTLLVTASLAHVLVGWAVYAACAHVWRAPVSAFACALAAVLCSRLAFYSPVLEANYLLCYPFLLLGYLESRSGARVEGCEGARVQHSNSPTLQLLHPCTFVLALLLLLIPLIVHPAGWLVMLLCIVMAFALGWTDRRATVVLALSAQCWPLVSRWLFPPTGYELELYGGVLDGLRALGHMSAWGSVNFLYIHTFTASITYLPALLVLVAVVISWAVLRERRLAALTLAGAAAFTLVYLITFHAGDAAVMQDRGILPVATPIAFSASALVMRAATPRTRLVALVLAVLVLVVKIRDVSFASRPFAEQYRSTEALITAARAQGVERGIVDAAVLRERGVEAGWAFPVEILLRSAVQGPEHGLILISGDNSPPTDALATGQLLILGLPWDVDANGSGYFRRSAGPYVQFVPQ